MRTLRTVTNESLSEDKITLDSATFSAIMNCVKKAILLVGDTSAQLSAKRREQILAKPNPLSRVKRIPLVLLDSPRKCPKSASTTSPKTERHSAHSLPIRILHNGRFEANSSSTCSKNIEYSRGVGIGNILPKNPDNTFTANSISGVHGELGEHEFNSAQNQTPESPKSL